MTARIASNSQPIPRPVMTVQGPVPYQTLGITDAHNHIWISAVPGADPGSPVLGQFDAILRELVEYRETGGRTLLDCQPGGCGRDGNKLLALSERSGVHVIACTGFHRRKYYSPHDAPWQRPAQVIADHLRSELEQGLQETLDRPMPVRAGFIKIALEATWEASPLEALEAAAAAALRTGSIIEIHTEKGAVAERACVHFMDLGVLPRQLVFCHMDKRPDAALHKALAGAGVTLEYDTFYRPKYDPAANLWPLIEEMAGAGFTDRIALATDLAESALYHSIGGGAGLASLPGEIRRQLRERGYSISAQEQLLGGNIARRLAGLS